MRSPVASAPRRTPSTPPTRPPRGASLVEALVALVLLLAGAAALGAALAAAPRAAHRARRAVLAEALVAERLAARDPWGPAACAPGAGTRDVPPLRERWRADTAGALVVLADSVAPADDAPTPRAAAVAVGACVP
jgi:hypothetical protein